MGLWGAAILGQRERGAIDGNAQQVGRTTEGGLSVDERKAVAFLIQLHLVAGGEVVGAQRGEDSRAVIVFLGAGSLQHAVGYGPRLGAATRGPALGQCLASEVFVNEFASEGGGGDESEEQEAAHPVPTHQLKNFFAFAKKLSCSGELFSPRAFANSESFSRCSVVSLFGTAICT